MLEVDTPYGQVTCQSGEYAGKMVAFIPRHGSSHSIPPHLINYRANLWALKKIGVRKILATTAVGSLDRQYKPGDFLFPDQFLDFTKSRAVTFYTGGERGVVHVDVTAPYCPELSRHIADSAAKLNLSSHSGGCYVCTEGPRFETPAEIKAYRQWGADVVGMTNLPECVLAREAEICYSTISMVTNFAAGISKEPLSHMEVVDCMNHNLESFKKIITILSKTYDPDTECSCHHAAKDFGGFHLL